MARSSSRLPRIQLVLLTLCVWSFAFGVKDGDALDPASGSRAKVSLTPRKQVQYTRTDEVKLKCPSLTRREPDADKQLVSSSWQVKRRLSFVYGDWEVETGSTHIVPFLQWDDTFLPAKTKLASFVVTDITDDLMLKGTLQLMIIDGKFINRVPQSSEASFTMERGLSILTIEVEGIYQQPESEDVVCLLGCTFLPSPDGGINFPNIQNLSRTKSLEKNCDIMVQLSYPITTNLTSMMVRGTMQSLVAPGGRYRFDPIVISSQVRISPKLYQPAPAGFVNEACPADASLESDSSIVSSYTASVNDLCALSNRYLQNSVLDIEPNWRCNGTTQNCLTIGPFSSYPAGTAFQADYNTSRARILAMAITSTSCRFYPAPDEVRAKFVFRLVPDSEYMGTIARRRSGLDGHTLVAEGYWDNRSRTLCMIACKVDEASGQPDNCNFRVTVHLPLSLSITQRNLFKGSISSLHSESFFPLAFHAKLDLSIRNLAHGYTSALRYNYSMIELAGAVLDQHEPESRSGVKMPWFKYPSLIGEEVGHYQSLANDLTFDTSLKPSQGKRLWNLLKFDLVAIDRYLPFVWSGFTEVESLVHPMPVNDTIVTRTDPDPSRRQETRKYLNCSGSLEFEGDFVDGETERLTISTEGLYNPRDGKMYMWGCRSIKGSWQEIDDSSFDLVDGMDCEIEVILQYPNTFSAWLLNPGVKVKVHSRRPVTDVFHFDDIETETYPMLYKGQREAMNSRKSIEGFLSVLTLSITLVCIVSQLLYMGNFEESTPYISLSMLGAQAMGFAIPLITGAESLLARKFDYRELYYFKESRSVQMIIYLDKILTLVALLLVLRFFEKVWRERGSLSNLGAAGNVPRERRVVMICFIIHAVGFISVMNLHSRHSLPGLDLANPALTSPSTNGTQVWPVETGFDKIRRGPWWQVSQEYTGLIEDLFLLPQVVGYGLWDVTGKPLRKFFFLGLTLLQIVPHIFDYLRSTRFFLYDAPIYANPAFDFYTNVGNILIPALALILALLVFCQQRWKGFLRLPSRFLYEPLGTKTSETELVSTNGRKHLPPIPEDDE